MKPELRDKVMALLWWVATLFLLVSVLTFHPQDIAWDSAPPARPVHNVGGLIGAYVAYALFRGLGWSAYLLTGLLGVWGWMRWRGMSFRLAPMRIIGTALLLLASSTLGSLSTPDLAHQVQRGGFLGVVTAEWCYRYLGSIGAHLVGWCVAILSLLAVTDFLAWTWGRVSFRIAQQGSVHGWGWLRRRLTRVRVTKPFAAGRSASMPAQGMATPSPRVTTTVVPARKLLEPKPAKMPAPGTPTITLADAPRPAASPSKKPRPAIVGTYQFPSVDLLNVPPPISERQIQENLEVSARRLEETLRDFEIQAQVVEVEKGPAITRYELQPAPGTKVSRIAALSEDIALMLKAQSVRVAPISGKSRVGVEVPNTISSTVYLREVIESPTFQRATSKLTLALGKNVSGDVLVTDLRECPHLLIAGTTGSGKTVCLNALITGFLYNATPDEVRLLLIDPKMVEMAVFNGLPHLVAPVVTDVKKASAALGWAVTEMERRYQRLAELGVRNIDGYNERVKAERSQTPSPDAGAEEPEPLELLPYIVLVIDELADLMVVAAQEVEGAIMRLAQLSRAVGIHLIMATQRPSVDVITGVIKANLPARISFQVASKIDARTVLDMAGAEKLLGRGDLLFLSPGSAKPTRAQGCYLTDAEIERVVTHVKAQREVSYDEHVLALQEKSAITMRGERDEYFDEAKRVVLETGQASTSMLQRRLRLGYTRAARVLDQLEEAGIVGPPRGAKPREILIERPVGVHSGETSEEQF